MVPGFPAQDLRFKIGLGEYDKRGEALCAFANRVHNSLACRGVFSYGSASVIKSRAATRAGIFFLPKRGAIVCLLSRRERKEARDLSRWGF